MKLWRDATDKTTLRNAVEALKRSCEAAYYFCEDQLAGEVHDDLMAAEWRLRQAERRG